jgi:hypothetical protein
MLQMKVGDKIRNDILTQNVEPLYKSEIANKISDTKCWRVTGSVFETLSKIFLSSGAILSFSSGYYNSTTLSFISGTVSTVSLAFLQFSAFCYKEQNRNLSELNMLLKKLNIETFPSSTHISSNRREDEKITINSKENSKKSNNNDDNDNKVDI